MIRSLAGLALSCCFLTNITAADGVRDEQPTCSLVLSCAAAHGDPDGVHYYALFAEDDSGRLTWDVAIDETTNSILIAGALQLEIEWETSELNREEFEDFLKPVGTKHSPSVFTHSHSVLMRVEGIWGEFDASTQWPCHKRQLIVRSVSQTVLGSSPASLRYRQLAPATLRTASGRQLIREYQRHGSRLFGTPYAPGAWPPPATIIFDGGIRARLDDFGSIRREMVRRGEKMAPRLARLLRHEITRPRERVRTKEDTEFLGPATSVHLIEPDRQSFAKDLMQLLATIGDPRSARLLLRIAEGYDDQATAGDRRAAMARLQQLTYVSLRPIGPYEGIGGMLIEHPDASELAQGEDDLEQQVKFFREWLAGEGKNPADWLPLARRRARLLLDSEQPGDVFRGAKFLCPIGHDTLRGGIYATGHDDDPDRTMDRLAAKMSEFQTNGVNFLWRQGRPVPGDRGAWVQLFVNYGTRARRHASLVIGFRLHNQQLAAVGGDEILAYLFEWLDAVSDSKAWLRQTIDRWAGRHFDTDEARKAWWRDNRDRPDEERMRASLPVLVGQADERNPEANRIVETVLPDAPPYVQQTATGAYVPGPSRVAWFKAHAADLRYDAERGVFRLPQEDS